MADEDYERCRYSIICHTEYLPVVHCLRALCELHVQGVPKPIGWGGTKASEWRSHHNQIWLRFTSSADREAFVADANRFLLAGSWTVVGRNDDDPAERQRRRQ